MTRLSLKLLMALALLTGSLADQDYFYDEEIGDEEELTHTPVFTSQPQRFDVRVGDNVTLPCLMDKVAGTIVWKSTKDGQQEQMYFLGPAKMTTDDRFRLEPAGDKGSTLTISRLRADESGQYMCQVTSTSPVTLTHTISVRYPPMVDMTPEDGVVVARQDSPVMMACMAKGNPTPTVTWTKKGGVLPDGNKKLEGMKLSIAKATRAHMGTYTCTVDNGVDSAVVKTFRLEVNSPPEIEAVKKVHTGEGHEATLVCTIHGQPLPKVDWSRLGDAALDSSRHRAEQEGALYSLKIDQVRDSDLGSYVCRARNDFGTASAVIELTGQPGEVMMTSAPYGQEKDAYTLRWNVESYAPIQEYKVTYKIAQSNNSSPKQQWEQITVPAPTKEGSTVMYSHLHTLKHLAPATEYEAVVTAKNKYGWSDETSKPFRLYTLGARQVLGSTDRSGAVSMARSGGALAVAAVLGALLAVL